MSDILTDAIKLLSLPEDEQIALFSEITGQSSLERVVLYGAWLSVRYAVDGHPIPPNTTVIDTAKAEFSSLPCSDVVTKVAGDATTVREMLGFVTHAGSKEWPRETFTENGKWLSHMLGTPKDPVMPRRDDIELATRLGVAPSRHLITEKFGDLQSYQDSLGFVTDTTLERWTDADWLDYGTWLSHMIGTPEEPAKLTVRDFMQASTLNIGPPVHVIYSKYGSFRKYQEALGAKPTRVDYKNWDKETFIENGIWLSHMLGTPESPRMPIQDDINEWTALGLVPPKSAIDKKFRRSLSVYQDALGFVTTATTERWTDENWIENGRWLGQLLLERGADTGLPTVEQITQAAELNIIPKLPQIVNRFGSVMKYQRALGYHSDLHYRLWSKRELLGHGFKLIQAKKGRAPTAEDYRMADGPGKEGICTRFGSLAQFHERLGLVSYRNSTRDQLISYGVRWAHEHEGHILSGSDLQMLSKNRQGPGQGCIYGKFDNLRQYQEEVVQAYEAFCARREEYTAVKSSSGFTFDFLARDFENTPQYEEVLAGRLQLVGELRRSAGTKVVKLIEMFGKSRRTILWDKEDFMYFRSLMNQKIADDPDAMVATLHKLDELGLSPYLDEIEEVFGSIEEFVKYA